MEHIQIMVSTNNTIKTCLHFLDDDPEHGPGLVISMQLVPILTQQTLHHPFDVHGTFILVVTSVSRLNHHRVKVEAHVDALIHLDRTDRVLPIAGEQCQLEEVVVVELRDGKMEVGLVLDFFVLVREGAR
jgi:hypothetical protein